MAVAIAEWGRAAGSRGRVRPGWPDSNVVVGERAALARAWVRHWYTDYEDRLDTACGDDLPLGELRYRAVKSPATQAVDDFMTAHRDIR